MSDDAKIDKQSEVDDAISALVDGAGRFVKVVARIHLYSAKRPAVFACDAEHRVSESCDAVPWSVIEEVLR